MKHFNYQSDFKIVEPLKAEAPFRYTYYTKKEGKSVVVEYDGTEYKNCIARDGELVIPIDGKALGIGEVKVKREYFLNDADFADGICNLVTDEVPTGIELWHGESDAAEEVRVEVAPYYHTIVVGGGGDADLSNYYTKTEVDAKIPTKTSQLTNDSGFLSSPITEQNLSEEVRDKLNKGGNLGTILDEEIYYDDGSKQVVPIKHPDLSTQPSILPYKFMGQYVYERLIPSADMLLSSMAEIPFSILPGNIMILDCACIYENGLSTPETLFKFSQGGSDFMWAFRMPLSDINYLGNLLYIKVVYTSMPEEGGDYYGYNNY